MRNLLLRVSVVASVAVALVVGSAVSAFAQTTTTAPADPVDSAFSTGQTSISGYIASGIGVIVAVLLLGLGVGLLVKYLRKAVRAA